MIALACSINATSSATSPGDVLRVVALHCLLKLACTEAAALHLAPPLLPSAACLASVSLSSLSFISFANLTIASRARTRSRGNGSVVVLVAGLSGALWRCCKAPARLLSHAHTLPCSSRALSARQSLAAVAVNTAGDPRVSSRGPLGITHLAGLAPAACCSFKTFMLAGSAQQGGLQNAWSWF